MHGLADLIVEMARHHLAALDGERSFVADGALDICRRLVEDPLDCSIGAASRIDQMPAALEIAKFALRRTIRQAATRQWREGWR